MIFTSDNGGLATSGQPTKLPATNNAPFREGKGYLYDGGIRVPLVVRWPGQHGSRARPATCRQSRSISPRRSAKHVRTPISDPQDGVSIIQLLEGRQFRRETRSTGTIRTTVHKVAAQGGAIREGDYKLIEFYDSGRRELFNLAKDVSESQNLIEREPEVAERLAAKFASWLKQVDAQMPTPNPGFVPDEQAEDGSITLAADTADVHGVMLRYEPLPHKNTLGFWVRQDDWAGWDFVVSKPGKFDVELLQGCGTGSGGSQVDIAGCRPDAHDDRPGNRRLSAVRAAHDRQRHDRQARPLHTLGQAAHQTRPSGDGLARGAAATEAIESLTPSLPARPRTALPQSASSRAALSES